MSQINTSNARAVIPHSEVSIIGAGPAGLMCAEVLSQAGVSVDVFDAMPSVGRKFLQAGVGGLNITHSEDYALFCTRFGASRTQLQRAIDRFPPSALRDWVHGLGIDTFVGSSGRVFPTQMKAAPLLRAWLHRLRGTGVRLHVRHRWLGWSDDGALRLANTEGEISLRPRATILALGGASWPQLGSDGAWVAYLRARGVEVLPLQSANCGFEVQWSARLREQYAGSPVKSVKLTFSDLQGHTEQRQGEMMISAQGVEGSLIYAFSRRLRETINSRGQATFNLDLAPGRNLDSVLAELNQRRRSRSLSSHLQRRIGLSAVKIALLREVLTQEQFADSSYLATKIKALPLTVRATRPIAEVISSAGGVCFGNLDQHLMLTNLPGTFVAGEMLDWEAPTGGYLLTACLATGRLAGQGVLHWLQLQSDYLA